MLEPIRGFEIPPSTLRYWRQVLKIYPSQEQLTKGLYSSEDVLILAGAILWMQSDRPLEAYGALIDAGFRLKDVVPEILETITLIEIKDVDYATQ